MSREAIEAVQDHSTVSDPVGLTVFIAIARFVGPAGEPGWASYRTLADVAHCDKDTVARWVGVLEELGELSVRKEGAGRGTRMYYTINLPFDKPKHGGAGAGDNRKRLSLSGGDNNAGTLVAELSQQIAELSQQIAVLSQQIELLSPSPSQNVPTREGQKPETGKPEKPGEETPARANDQGDLLLGVPAPATAGERALLDHPATLLWVKTTGRWPGYAVLPGIVERLGEEPDKAALERAWQSWLLSHYNPDNALGVLDWYREMRADPDWEPGRRFKQPIRAPAPNGRPAGEIAVDENGFF